MPTSASFCVKIYQNRHFLPICHSNEHEKHVAHFNTSNHFYAQKWLVISSDIRRSDSSTLILSRSNTAILIVGNGVTCGLDVIGDTNIITLISLQGYKKQMKYANLVENILLFQKKQYLCTN